MTVEKITIPDFGDVQQITVVELFVAAGDRVEVDASLIALESEKAVMDIPSPYSGVIKEMLVKEDDVVQSGDLIALIETEQETDGSAEEVAEEKHTAEAQPPAAAEPAENTDIPAPDEAEEKSVPANDQPLARVGHATPSVRAFAREQQVELSTVTGTGPHGRILREDVMAALAQSQGTPSLSPNSSGPAVEKSSLEEFSKYGEIEELSLGKIQRISGPHLHKSWISIPHVTHFEEADVSELERFRKQLNSELAEEEKSFSPLVFIIRAVAAALKAFPFFNCSLSGTGESVILKRYYHIGIAVDTPNGLVVPVIKNVDRLGFKEIGAELRRLSSSARAGKLAIPDIQGATFTISSLGSIGGTGFTPIISSPQVAILGLSRSFVKPVWNGEQFVPQQTLPFSVSYDHRVIDGAGAARFCRHLRLNIEDLKRTLL